MLNWGIYGAGKIADSFAKDFSKVEQAKLVAAYARNTEKLKKFCDKHKIENAYDDVEAFLSDERIDVVYIATPHSLHAEAALKAIKAGKHVLCEKPFALNAKQATEVMKAAKENNVFIMEAIWTLFLPTIKKVFAWIDSGKIGPIKHIQANFGFKGNLDPEWRLMNPALGGGALLDVGIYPVMISNAIMKERPISIKANAKLTSTGVDGTTSIVLEYSDHVMASLNASIETQMLNTLIIYGELGRIEVPSFWMSDKAYLIIDDDIEIFNADDDEKNGYHHETRAVCDAIEHGKIELKSVSHDFTISLMETLDFIRREIGVIYDVD